MLGPSGIASQTTTLNHLTISSTMTLLQQHIAHWSSPTQINTITNHSPTHPHPFPLLHRTRPDRSSSSSSSATTAGFPSIPKGVPEVLSLRLDATSCCAASAPTPTPTRTRSTTNPFILNEIVETICRALRPRLDGLPRRARRLTCLCRELRFCDLFSSQKHGSAKFYIALPSEIQSAILFPPPSNPE